MARLSTVKKRLDALSKAIEEYEMTVNEPVVEAPIQVDIREELAKLNLEQLKEINAYVTELMLSKVSRKSSYEKKGMRMSLAQKQNMVNKYLEEGDADPGEKDWYRQIEAKKNRDRNEEEQKKFVEFRARAQKWFEARYPQA